MVDEIVDLFRGLPFHDKVPKMQAGYGGCHGTSKVFKNMQNEMKQSKIACVFTKSFALFII
jgi:hypothetical protein